MPSEEVLLNCGSIELGGATNIFGLESMEKRQDTAKTTSPIRPSPTRDAKSTFGVARTPDKAADASSSSYKHRRGMMRVACG